MFNNIKCSSCWLAKIQCIIVTVLIYYFKLFCNVIAIYALIAVYYTLWNDHHYIMFDINCIVLINSHFINY
jgi:hypothetical protein